MSDIDKVLSTVQTIAWVWMCMHYLLPPMIHLLMRRALGENK